MRRSGQISGGLAVGKPVIDVLAVRAAVREALVTLWTLERLLPAVESLVLGQVVLMFESLVTLCAFVWT